MSEGDWASLKKSVIEIEAALRGALQGHLNNNKTITGKWKPKAKAELNTFLWIYCQHLLLYCNLWGLKSALQLARKDGKESNDVLQRKKDCAARLYHGWNQVLDGNCYSHDDIRY